MQISVLHLNSCLQKKNPKQKTFDIDSIVTPAHFFHDVNPGFDLNTW